MKKIKYEVSRSVRPITHDVSKEDRSLLDNEGLVAWAKERVANMGKPESQSIIDSFKHSAVYPWWRRILIKIPLLGRLFRRTVKFKKITMPDVDKLWPKIDPEWFDKEYQQYKMPPEMIYGGSMSIGMAKAGVETVGGKKARSGHLAQTASMGYVCSVCNSFDVRRVPGDPPYRCFGCGTKIFG